MKLMKLKFLFLELTAQVYNTLIDNPLLKPSKTSISIDISH